MASADAPATFERKATGLVREAGWWDVLVYVVSIAAIAFPYRLPEVFESSPVRWRWAGLPVMSIVGAISLVACVASEINARRGIDVAKRFAEIPVE
ncbi:MAG: hypothetical protein M3P14_01975 [Chloroflexota bacterium]|nr:hypothetical protein [Chloroflexota bacterium]